MSIKIGGIEFDHHAYDEARLAVMPPWPTVTILQLLPAAEPWRTIAER